MTRYTAAADAAITKYRELITEIRSMRAKDRRSFLRALLDVGDATMHGEGPLHDDCDLDLSHYDGLQALWHIAQCDEGESFDAALRRRDGARQDKRRARPPAKVQGPELVVGQAVEPEAIDALAALVGRSDAQTADIYRHSFTLGIGDALTGRCTGSYSGGSHYVVRHGVLNAQRLRREPGDALCKRKGKFWGLMVRAGDDRREPTCKRCREIAARLGVTLPQESGKVGT